MNENSLKSIPLAFALGMSLVSTSFSDTLVTVDTTAQGEFISPNLIGANAMMHKMTDDLIDGNPDEEGVKEWDIENDLKLLGIKLMRFPGGNELDHYHFEYPNIRQYRDYFQTNPGASDFVQVGQDNQTQNMSLEEYLDFCEMVESIPIVGVNMNSMRSLTDPNYTVYTLADSIDEAELLMAAINANVEEDDLIYVYVDNEPFDVPSIEMASWASEFKDHVDAIKLIRSNVKVVFNIASTIRKGSYAWDDRTKPFLALAGTHIDILDVHPYWEWSGGSEATFDKFLAQNPLLYRHKGQGEKSFVEEFTHARNWLDSNEFGHIELAAFEWNVGKSGDENWTDNKLALVQSEMMMQFMEAGVDYANIWPVVNSAQSPQARGLFDPENSYTPRSGYHTLKMLSKAVGYDVVSSTSTWKKMRVLSAYDQTAKKLRVYLLNKSEWDEDCTISTGGIVDWSWAQVHTGDIATDTSSRLTAPSTDTGGDVEFTIPKYSFAKVTIKLQ